MSILLRTLKPWLHITIYCVYPAFTDEPTHTFEEWQSLIRSEQSAQNDAGSSSVNAQVVSMNDGDFNYGFHSHSRRRENAQPNCKLFSLISCNYQ